MCWFERLVLLLSLLYLCVHTMPRAWSSINTDFPNYYMSARLAHEGYDTARMYEWTWLQREKDHRAIDIRIIGLLPITPFSTLAAWPLTKMPALAAKHVWILLNLGLLVPVGWMLRSMTGLTSQRIALVFALSFPLHRNLLYGQFYIVLLLLIVAACWSFLRKYDALAGSLVALAAACKIFPLLFLLFFLRRRAWRALAWGVVTGLACAAISVSVFGLAVHLTYIREILPWTLRGEALPPYATASASISSVLHYLFLAEPQWNPHPWRNSPLCYALLEPTIQMLALAPAILLIREGNRNQDRILMEWSALLVASLAISTIPASYNFVLVALPVCVLTSRLIQRRNYGWLAALLVAYLGIGFPMSAPANETGLRILLYVPRLFFTLALLLGIYISLWRDRPAKRDDRMWGQSAWAALMAISAISSVLSTFRQESAVRQEFAYRLPVTSQAFIEADPHSAGADVRFIAFTPTGYHLAATDWNDALHDFQSDDELSFTSSSNHTLVERATNSGSQIRDFRDPSEVVVGNAHDPMLSEDGQSLAYIREDHGNGRLMARTGLHSGNSTEILLTPSSLNIYEASFRSNGEYAFSAIEDGGAPRIYLADASHFIAPLPLGESRYPALSPDGRWMVYSRFEGDAWNLWVRNQGTGATRRVANVPCNQIQPSWEEDSKTVLYSTDCGRSLWFTAVARRQIIP
jgi:Tol biopolymer transport system component